MAPRLTSCCCCFTPSTGAKILAILGIIGAAGTILSMSSTLTNLDDIKHNLDLAIEESKKEEATKPAEEKDAYEFQQNMLEFTKNNIGCFVGAELVCGIFQLAIASFMIYGVNKKKHTFMLPWLIVHMISLVVSTLIIVGVIIYLFTVPQGYIVSLALLIFVSPFVALGFHFWFVVNSVYLDIKEEQGDHMKLVESN